MLTQCILHICHFFNRLSLILIIGDNKSQLNNVQAGIIACQTDIICCKLNGKQSELNGKTRKDRVGPCGLLTSKHLKFVVTWITYSSFHLFSLSSLLLLPLFLSTALHILSRKLITSTSSKTQHFHNGICTQVS